MDLQRGRVIDLLPDRDAEIVKKWLKEHPGVELVSRDRWSDYAQAAAEAAPDAQQVTYRWHLLKSLILGKGFDPQGNRPVLKATGLGPHLGPGGQSVKRKRRSVQTAMNPSKALIFFPSFRDLG